MRGIRAVDCIIFPARKCSYSTAPRRICEAALCAQYRSFPESNNVVENSNLAFAGARFHHGPIFKPARGRSREAAPFDSSGLFRFGEWPASATEQPHVGRELLGNLGRDFQRLSAHRHAEKIDIRIRFGEPRLGWKRPPYCSGIFSGPITSR